MRIIQRNVCHPFVVAFICVACANVASGQANPFQVPDGGQQRVDEQEKEAFPPRVVPVAESIPESEQRIYAELEEPTTLEFITVALSDVVLNLSDRHRIPIMLDRRALEAAGVEASHPITSSVTGVKLRTALETMLKPIGLTWTVRDEVLLITTPEVARANRKTFVYAVPDLMKPNTDLDVGDSDADGLRSVVSLVTDELYVHEGNLIVTADDRTQIEVQAAMNGLRMANARYDLGWSFRDPVFLSSRYQGSGFDKVAKALKSPVKVEFIEISLSDALLSLSDTHGIPIYLDKGNLEPGVEDIVTANLQGITLESALNLILAECELAWTIHGGLLVVTSQGEAEDNRPLAAHMVRDLADQPNTHRQDYDSLIDLIMTQIRPDTWDAGTGPHAGVAVFQQADAVVMRQSYQTHWEIHKLLTDLRKSPARPKWSSEAQEQERRAYLNRPARHTFVKRSATPADGTELTQVIKMVEASLPDDVLQRADLLTDGDRFSVKLSPAEAAELERKLAKAGWPSWQPTYLPWSRSDSAGGFSAGGFDR